MMTADFWVVLQTAKMRSSLQILATAVFAAALHSLAAPITEPLDAIRRDIDPSEPQYPTPNSITSDLFGLKVAN
jgi:hypothetical protein